MNTDDPRILSFRRCEDIKTLEQLNSLLQDPEYNKFFPDTQQILMYFYVQNNIRHPDLVFNIEDTCEKSFNAKNNIKKIEKWDFY